MARISGMRLVRIILTVAFLAAGAGAKTYIDSHNNQISVDDVIEVVESKGYNHGGILHVSGTLKNKSDIDNVKVTMKVSFLDASKNPIGSGKTVEREDLDAGESWKFDVPSLGKNAEYYSIDSINIEWE